MKTFVKKDLKYKETKEKLKNEVEVLSKLHHPFINQILDSFVTETHFFIGVVIQKMKNYFFEIN